MMKTAAPRKRRVKNSKKKKIATIYFVIFDLKGADTSTLIFTLEGPFPKESVEKKNY